MASAPGHLPRRNFIASSHGTTALTRSSASDASRASAWFVPRYIFDAGEGTRPAVLDAGRDARLCRDDAREDNET